MIYEYECTQCLITKEIIKEVEHYNRPEFCSCGNEMNKLFSRTQLICNDRGEYNYGLGEYVKNKRHKREILKRKDFIEVGSETPQTIEKCAEKIKTDRWNNRWNSV